MCIRDSIGAVLSQDFGNGDQPVAYASRVLNAAESRYATVERELLAIVFFLKYFRPYLYERHFTIYTDHKPLTGIMKLSDQTSRLARWNLKMQDYDFDIKYRPGSKHGNADGMSRIPSTIVCAVTRQQKPNLSEEQKKLKLEQEQDPLYAAIIAKLRG